MEARHKDNSGLVGIVGKTTSYQVPLKDHSVYKVVKYWVPAYARSKPGLGCSKAG